MSWFIPLAGSHPASQPARYEELLLVLFITGYLVVMETEKASTATCDSQAFG